MKIAKNVGIVLVGIAVLLTGSVARKAETALEDSPWGNVVDGLMIAALFFGTMKLLQWAVWVLR